MERGVKEEHWGAMNSAFYTVQRLGQATVQDVMTQQGLCEIRAKKALEDLFHAGRVRKINRRYVLPTPRSPTPEAS